MNTSNTFCNRWTIQAVIFLLIAVPFYAKAQFLVGGPFICDIGDCDPNLSLQSGDHHNVDLEEHLIEAKAKGNWGKHRKAIARIGVNFKPCFSGPVEININDIHIVGLLKGFGGTEVIRADVLVESLVKDSTDEVELGKETLFYREERTDDPDNINERLQSQFIIAVIEDHRYEVWLTLRARKWGAGGISDFKDNHRGVSFGSITINPLLTDSDGDGLPDDWEVNGLDDDCDGEIDLDLPSMGADPNTKDIYLELDWMEGSEPNKNSIAAVIEAFGLAPENAGGVTTPGKGINFWVDTGDLIDPNASEDGGTPGSCTDGQDNGGNDGFDNQDPDCLVGSPIFAIPIDGASLGGGNSFRVSGIANLTDDSNDDGQTDFEEAKYDAAKGNFDKSRNGIFRYGIRGVAAGPPPGIGGQAFKDLILFNDNPGLLMHEFGHLLGLSHGGPGDDNNCKPNYISVMNYRYQAGIMVDSGSSSQDLDGDGNEDGFILDYSPPRITNGRAAAPLAALDETNLSEANALDVSDTANFMEWTYGGAIASEDNGGPNTCGDGIDNGGDGAADTLDGDCQFLLANARLNTAPDWNQDGDNADSGPPPIKLNTSYWVPAGEEGKGSGQNSCNNGIDDDGDGLIDFADAGDCTGNRLCASADNLNNTNHQGANDWASIILDPKKRYLASAGDLTLWTEPSESELLLMKKARQTTDLAIVDSQVTPDLVAAGQNMEYQIVIKNLGPKPAIDTALIVTLPTELIYLDSDAPCELTEENQLICDSGRLESKEEKTIHIGLRVRVDLACAPEAQFTELASLAEVINRGGYDTDLSNNEARIESKILCARYEYAGKFTCGIQENQVENLLSKGRYLSITNIHNPNDDDIVLYHKLAVSFPPLESESGKIISMEFKELAYDQALKVNCLDITKAYGTPEPFLEGYLIVQSGLPLDVDTVYTVSSPQTGGTSIDVETIAERERKPGARPDLIIEPKHPEPGFSKEFKTQLPTGTPNSFYCGDVGEDGSVVSTSLDAVVKNIGSGVASPSHLFVRFQDGSTNEASIELLSSGETKEISFPIPASCYSSTICSFELVVDNRELVNEENEGNNEADSYCLGPAG